MWFFILAPPDGGAWGRGTRIPTSGFALSLRLGHASGFQTRAGAGSSIRGAIGRDMHAYRHSSAAWSSCSVSTSSGRAAENRSSGTVRRNAAQLSNTYIPGSPSSSNCRR